MEIGEGGVGTPSPDATWHAFLSELAPSRSPPKETRDAFLLSGLPHGEANITSVQSSYYIRTTDISYPDMFVWIVD